jgi:hypothetical protein
MDGGPSWLPNWQPFVCTYLVFNLCCFVEMENEKLEIRVLLRHYWKQDYKAGAAARKICEVEGERVVSTHTAQKWYLLSQFGLRKKHYEIGNPSKKQFKQPKN